MSTRYALQREFIEKPPINNLEIISGTGTDSFAEKVFSRFIRELEIRIFTNPAIIQISKDGVNYSSDVGYWGDFDWGKEGPFKSVKIKNKTAGSNCEYYLVGFY